MRHDLLAMQPATGQHGMLGSRSCRCRVRLGPGGQRFCSGGLQRLARQQVLPGVLQVPLAALPAQPSTQQVMRQPLRACNKTRDASSSPW